MQALVRVGVRVHQLQALTDTDGQTDRELETGRELDTARRIDGATVYGPTTLRLQLSSRQHPTTYTRLPYLLPPLDDRVELELRRLAW